MDEQAGAEAETGDRLLLRRKRALYRAQYRGTKEMDWMIGRYAVAKLDAMSLDQLQTFETFLELGIRRSMPGCWRRQLAKSLCLRC